MKESVRVTRAFLKIWEEEFRGKQGGDGMFLACLIACAKTTADEIVAINPDFQPHAAGMFYKAADDIAAPR